MSVNSECLLFVVIGCLIGDCNRPFNITTTTTTTKLVSLLLLVWWSRVIESRSRSLLHTLSYHYDVWYNTWWLTRRLSTNNAANEATLWPASTNLSMVAMSASNQRVSLMQFYKCPWLAPTRGTVFLIKADPLVTIRFGQGSAVPHIF